MKINLNVFGVFVSVLLLFMAFTYGRTYDVGVFVNQPEYNHVVRVDYCKVVEDTSHNVMGIWYKEQLYMLDTVIFKNL